MSEDISPLVTCSLGTVADSDSADVEVDFVWLTSDERASPHRTVRSEGGRTLRISFQRGEGSELADGDILAYDGETAIVVRAVPEDLLVVRPASALEWGIAGFQLGNLHCPVRFGCEAMLTPYDPMVMTVLDALEVDYERKETPFIGRRFGAYTGHSH